MGSREMRLNLLVSQLAVSPVRGDAMWELLRKIANDDEGQDLVEYALLVTLVIVGLINLVVPVGTTVENLFISVAGQF
jgi:Flp pilus assembly pilin Flp